MCTNLCSLCPHLFIFSRLTCSHWTVSHQGTCPGLNLVYGHCNLLIEKQDVDMFLVVGKCACPVTASLLLHCHCHYLTITGDSFRICHMLILSVFFCLHAGPGHGAPSPLANYFLEGSLEHYYPQYTNDEKGVYRFVRVCCSHASTCTRTRPVRTLHPYQQTDNSYL